jgi:phage baseplate assembly protein V
MSAMLTSLARKIRLSIGLGIVKLVDDAREIQQLQVTAFRGEVRDKLNRYQDYGFTSTPKEGAEAVLAAIGGNRSHLVALRVDDGRYRKKSLNDGEVCMYHWEGGYVLLKNGKEIDIVMPEGKVNVTSPEVTVTASTKVTIDSPSVECKHDLKVLGKIDVSQDATFGAKIDASGDITGLTVKDAAGKVLGTHIHTSASPGSPTSPPL